MHYSILHKIKDLTYFYCNICFSITVYFNQPSRIFIPIMSFLKHVALHSLKISKLSLHFQKSHKHNVRAYMAHLFDKQSLHLYAFNISETPPTSEATHGTPSTIASP